MNEHADLELIAAFREGLLRSTDGDRIGHHLSRCGECALRQAALDDVTTALAQAAPPLPPSLARRLDAALAAEMTAARAAAGGAPSRAAQGARREQESRPARQQRAGRSRARHGHGGRAPSGRPAGAARPGRHDRPSRRRMARALRPLAVAASVCVLAGGGYLLANSLTRTPPGSTAAGKSGANAPAASGAGMAPRSHMYAPQGGATVAKVAIEHSQTSYQPAQLRSQAATVASKYASSIPSSPGKAGYTTVQPFGTSSALAGCLRRVTGSQSGMIVDMASYAGHPAMVIIEPRRGTVAGHVWVVGTGCSASASDIRASSGF
jgi:hypothetical protein